MLELSRAALCGFKSPVFEYAFLNQSFWDPGCMIIQFYPSICKYPFNFRN